MKLLKTTTTKILLGKVVPLLPVPFLNEREINNFNLTGFIQKNRLFCFRAQFGICNWQAVFFARS